MQVNMHEAKAQLSKLVERAHGGEEVIIAKAGTGTPYVRLAPLDMLHSRRLPGRMREELKTCRTRFGSNRMRIWKHCSMTVI